MPWVSLGGIYCVQADCWGEHRDREDRERMGMVPDSEMHTNDPDTRGAQLESDQSTDSLPTAAAQGTQVREPDQELGFCFLSC